MSNSGLLQLSSPITVAGLRWIFTTLPLDCLYLSIQFILKNYNLKKEKIQFFSSNTDLSVLIKLQKGFSIYFLCYEKIVLVNPINFRLKK